MVQNGISAPGENIRSVRVTVSDSSFWIHPRSSQMVSGYKWDRSVKVNTQAASFLNCLALLFIKTRYSILVSHEHPSEEELAFQLHLR